MMTWQEKREYRTIEAKKKRKQSRKEHGGIIVVEVVEVKMMMTTMMMMVFGLIQTHGRTTLVILVVVVVMVPHRALFLASQEPISICLYSERVMHFYFRFLYSPCTKISFTPISHLITYTLPQKRKC